MYYVKEYNLLIVSMTWESAEDWAEDRNPRHVELCFRTANYMFFFRGKQTVLYIWWLKHLKDMNFLFINRFTMCDCSQMNLESLGTGKKSQEFCHPSL